MARPIKAVGNNLAKDSKSQSAGIVDIANDLTEHFFSHPEAGDTVEGIADWWVARQRRSNAMRLIQTALEYLVEEGVVQKRSYGNREIYSSKGLDQSI
jgi:hypothetical protein